MTNIKLLGDRLLVKVKSTKKETESGIVLPESSVSKSQIGTVVAVGDGRITHDGNIIPMVVEPDDNILFDKFAGTVIVVDDEELLDAVTDFIYDDYFSNTDIADNCEYVFAVKITRPIVKIMKAT